MKEKRLEQPRSRWVPVIVVIALLGVISFFAAIVIGIFLSSSDIEPAGNVALISINGPIVSTSPGGFGSSAYTTSTDIIKFIKKAEENKDIKAILFEINSPGGSAVASWEISRAIEKSNKTTVAWIREAGTSGAYWAASSCDLIIASPLSITGSIGVLASYVDFAGTLERYNASYQRMVAGKYKDMGSPLKHITDEEEELFQDKLDLMHDFFRDSVEKNRNLSDIEDLAQGQFFLGMEAVDLGLIDSLGGKEEAIEWIEKREGIDVELAEYKKTKSLGELLAGMTSIDSFELGRGIGSSVSEQDAMIRT